MATFAGKQAGADNPTMRHETDQQSFAVTETYVFTGEQPKGTAPAQPTINLKPAKPSEV